MVRDYKISWQEMEYEFVEKSSDWYWALGIISVAIAITSVILENILFAVLVLVGAFTISLYATKKPELTDYEINQKGVMIDDILYPYNSLDSFWITENGEMPKLLISSKKLLMPRLVIPIGEEVDTEELRDYLLDRVDEEEQGEPLSSALINWLGF